MGGCGPGVKSSRKKLQLVCFCFKFADLSSCYAVRHVPARELRLQLRPASCLKGLCALYRDSADEANKCACKVSSVTKSKPVITGARSKGFHVTLPAGS